MSYSTSCRKFRDFVPFLVCYLHERFMLIDKCKVYTSSEAPMMRLYCTMLLTSAFLDRK